MRLKSLLRLALLTASVPVAGSAQTCPVAQPHPLTAPQIAMINGQYAEAEGLYRAAIAKHPQDDALTAGLVQVLLAEQKVDDAAKTVWAGLAKDSQSPALLTAIAEVQHRQGLPWKEQESLREAQAHGICYPLLHLALARFYRFNSYYASALHEIQLAHELDPYDPEIQRAWAQSLPPNQRIRELKRYLEVNKGNDEEARRARTELAVLENEEQGTGTCHLVSQVTSTEIPFAPIMFSAQLVQAWGLEVKFNNHKSRLVIDTGANGLYINRSLAQKAGLKPVTRTQTTGIGDNGPQSGYLARADSIKIGGLEFRNCMVEVSDRRSVVGNDGLIGMNVFSHFLVTLDFPWRKLKLGPLPPYPGTTAAPLNLNTSGQEQLSAGSGAHDRYVAPDMKNWMRVYRVGHILIIPGTVNRKNVGLFVIDTGAQMSALSPKAALAVAKVHADDWLRIRGVDGTVKKSSYAQDISVRFGNLEKKYSRMTVFSLEGLSKETGTEISGLLGEDTLGVLMVQIDYRDGLMNFEYSPNRGFQHFQ